MFIQRTGHRSLKALQTQSLAYQKSIITRNRHENAGWVQKLWQAEWKPKTCQWIEGTPSKQEIRRHGTDKFMCGKAVKFESSYCDHHHGIAYVVKPLTTDTEQAPSDE